MSESAPTEVEQTLKGILQPARELEAQLEAKAQQQVAALEETRAQLRHVRAVLRAAEGQAPAKPGGKKGTSSTVSKKTPSAEVVAATREFIESRNGDLADGFTGSQLAERMHAAGVLPGIGRDRIRGAVEVLYDDGFLRLDRIVKGGGKLLKVTV